MKKIIIIGVNEGDRSRNEYVPNVYLISRKNLTEKVEMKQRQVVKINEMEVEGQGNR